MKISAKIPLRLLLLSAACLALTNCAATRLTDAQKQSITSVSVAEPAVETNDFHAADGTDSPNASSSVPTATGGGIIPALLGAAIDSGVTAYQGAQFRKQYGEKLASVDAVVPRTIGVDLRKRAAVVLKKDAFFGPKMMSQSDTKFDGELLNYGLTRSYRKDDQTYLGATVSLNVWLIGKDGKKLFTRKLDLRSGSSFTIDEYATDKKRVTKVFNEAFSDFEVQFADLLNTQMGR